MKKIIKCLSIFPFIRFVFSNVYASEEKPRISRFLNESIVENICWSHVSKIVCYVAAVIIAMSCIGYVAASASKKQEIKKMVGATLIISVLTLETSFVSNMIKSSKYGLAKLEEQYQNMETNINTDITTISLDEYPKN